VLICRKDSEQSVRPSPLRFDCGSFSSLGLLKAERVLASY